MSPESPPRVLLAEDLYRDPNPLASDYGRFGVGERLLLTGHSHQAWPDVAERGQLEAFADAALHVDDKWPRAFAKAERVREGYRRLLDDPDGEIALGPNTHELLVKLISGLPLFARPRIVTTGSEYHSARRQLDRLAEADLCELVRVPSQPVESVGARLAAEVDDRTSCALVSTVFFDSAEIAGQLDALYQACRHFGARFVLDTYHQLNVVPFSLRDRGWSQAYVVSAGYKYCQLGEGNAILRFPADEAMRPLVTGWYAEFDTMTRAAQDHQVAFGSGPWRFAGATYDPTSNYRAAEVFDFFSHRGLEPQLLRRVSQHQIGLLRDEIDALDLPPELLARPDIPLERLAGFLALRSPRAAEIQRGLAAAGIQTDSRRDVLRLGPAPYLSDRQLRDAVAGLGEVVRDLSP